MRRENLCVNNSTGLQAFRKVTNVPDSNGPGLANHAVPITKEVSPEMMKIQLDAGVVRTRVPATDIGLTAGIAATR